MNKSVGVLAWVLLLSTHVIAQSPNFKVSPQFPKELDTISVSYDARNTVLKDAASLVGNYTGFQDFKWIQGSLNFVKTDSVWTAPFALPPKMALLNFTFQSDTIEDRGGNPTYSHIFSSNEGRQMSGGMLAWGMLRAPDIVAGTPYVVDSAAYINDELVMMWVKYELQYHPENRFKVLYAAASALKHMNTTASLERLQQELQTLQRTEKLNEDELIQLMNVYKNILKDSVKVGEIENRIKIDFPAGQFVRDQSRLADFKMIQEAKDDDSRLRSAMNFIDKHPYKVSEIAFNEMNRINYTNVYWIISVYTSMNKNLELYTKYISQAAPYEVFGQVVYRSIDVPFRSQQSVSAQEILPYAKVVMDRINYFKNGPEGDKYPGIYYSNAPLFAKILEINKLYDEAFVYAAAAQSTQSYQNADLNDTYVRILEGQGKTRELETALEKSYSLNQSSIYMLELMKTRYVKTKGSDKGYETYLAGLKDGDKKMELKNKVQKMLINKDFSDFELLDQFGNKVKLSEQKGKIVVLDFWASWCAPCKAAFPGMKLAVEHFKDDPNVKFYFVDTQEKNPDMKEYVTNYMETNDYPFTVLLDVNSEVSKTAGVTAIPHKMVIGADGKLRFSEIGYMGSASELADEIIEMVNVLKVNK